MDITIPTKYLSRSSGLDISEKDIITAMKAIQGYIDITPGDFKEIYQAAYTLAIQRLFNSFTATDLMTKSVLLVNHEMELEEAAAYVPIVAAFSEYHSGDEAARSFATSNNSRPSVAMPSSSAIRSIFFSS